MSSEIETFLDISSSRRMQRFLDSARNDEAQQARRALFAHLTIYHEERPHPAAINMAIDEALLETVVVPTIRFYRWQSPALSFGYFGKFSNVAIYAPERDLIRRWTGGGIVFHKDDLTYSIVIPANDPVFEESSMVLYERIHRALCGALAGIGQNAEVVGSACCADSRKLSGQRGIPTCNCFANPVRADVMLDDRKIAGAAQRRTRRGLLQQGSIQGIDIKTDLAQKFAQAMSANCSESVVREEILQRAGELAREKYGSDSWLKKR